MRINTKPIQQYTLGRFLLLIGFLLFLSSCEYNSISSSSSTELTFENVQVLLQNSCSGGNCHVGQRTSGVRLDGYQNVINSVGTQYGIEVVKAGDSDGSPIIDKLEADPQFGNRMPFGRSPLSQSQIDLIKNWINNGAPND